MDNLGIELLKQVPSLGVLCWLVWKHSNAQSDMQKSFLAHLATAQSARDESLIDVAERCHVVQRDAIEAIKDNSAVLGGVREALTHFESRSET